MKFLLGLLALGASAQAANPVLDPGVLGEIARRASALPAEQALDYAQAELRARYGERIAPGRSWVFNDAGNALFQLTVLYCSPSEYLVFINSPVETGGYSGRFRNLELWDFVLAGRLRSFRPGQLVARSTGPGELSYLKSGEHYGFRVDEGTTGLEYGRGSIFSLFAFGVVAPARYLTRDWRSAWAQVRDCGKLALKRR